MDLGGNKVSLITCKFGGASLADGQRVKAAARIIRSNPQRRFVVVSAPGKRWDGDQKITDLLLRWHANLRNRQDCGPQQRAVEERFSQIADELKVDFNPVGLIKEIAGQATREKSGDYLASRGEYLNGRLVATYLGADFVDPGRHLVLNAAGELTEESYQGLKKSLTGNHLTVIPGFYGRGANGQIKTFSRGGSDISGAAVARATSSALYENWTDVSGIRLTDPRVVPQSVAMPEIGYQELAELARYGAQVLHSDAVAPVAEKGIPVHVRNTQAPEDPGTVITDKRSTSRIIAGITGQKGFACLNIHKKGLGKNPQLTAAILESAKNFRIVWQDFSVQSDYFMGLVSEETLAENQAAFTEVIDQTLAPCKLTFVPEQARLVLVGRDIKKHSCLVGGQLARSLNNAAIDIAYMSLGISPVILIVGLAACDLEKAWQAAYRSFENL